MDNNQKVKAVLYARVSSDKQEQEGYSIPSQLDLLREYARKNNIEIVEEFVESESAKVSGRKKFKELLHFLKKHKNITNILVEKTDRLYRNFNDYVTLDESIYSIHLVKEYKVLSSNSSSSEKLEHAFRVIIAKNYIDNLREETQKGRYRKVLSGYFIGQVPYGYMKLDKETTVLHPEHSKYVKRAFELYALENLSLKALRKRLYDEGYTYLPSSSMASKSQLEKMLKNECYIGLLKYNSKIYPGKHEPIVSKSLFNKAQIAFKKDNKPNCLLKHNHLYKGLIKCARCGRSITSQKQKGIIYYNCTGNYGKCKPVYVGEEILDKQFNNAIKAVTIDESLADYLNELLNNNYNELQIMTKEKADYLKREIEKIKTRKDKLFDTYMDGEIPKETWSFKNTKYESEILRLEEQIKINKLDNDNFINEGRKIIELARSLYSLYISKNIDEKKKMLKLLFSNLKLDGEKLSYDYNRPFCYFVKMGENMKKLPRLDSNQQPTG